MLDSNNLWPRWETVRLIGRGSFGAVYEIQRDILGDTEKAAVKYACQEKVDTKKL